MASKQFAQQYRNREQKLISVYIFKKPWDFTKEKSNLRQEYNIQKK